MPLKKTASIQFDFGRNSTTIGALFYQLPIITFKTLRKIMDEKAITKIRQQFTAAVLCGDEREKKIRLSIGDLIDKYSVVEKLDIEKVRPWCHEDFLARLRTFQLAAAWFAKPSTISALECARHGWCNNGIDELKCHSCGISIFHTKGMRYDHFFC